jgi:hypothetical protein
MRAEQTDGAAPIDRFVIIMFGRISYNEENMVII